MNIEVKINVSNSSELEIISKMLKDISSLEGVGGEIKPCKCKCKATKEEPKKEEPKKEEPKKEEPKKEEPKKEEPKKEEPKKEEPKKEEPKKAVKKAVKKPKEDVSLFSEPEAIKSTDIATPEEINKLVAKIGKADRSKFAQIKAKVAEYGIKSLTELTDVQNLDFQSYLKSLL